MSSWQRKSVLSVVILIALMLVATTLAPGSSQAQPRLGASRLFVAGQDYPVGLNTVPSGITNPVAVGAGLYHNLVVKSDGTVIAWGNNDDGQTNVPAGLSGVVAVTGGSTFSLALKSDGTVVAWGTMSQWDPATNISTAVPAFVPAEATNVVKIAAGGLLALALKSDGTVVQWGNNRCVENCAFQSTIELPTGLTGVIDIAMGSMSRPNLVALKSDGTLVQWGESQLTNPAPTSIVGATKIVVGDTHGLALVPGGTNGGVTGWGSGQQASPSHLGFILGGGQTVDVIAATQFYSYAGFTNETNSMYAWGDSVYGWPKDENGTLSEVTHVSAMAGAGRHLIGIMAPLDPTATPTPYRTATRSITRTPCAGTCTSLEVWGNDHWGVLDVPAGVGQAAALSLRYHAAAVLPDGTARVWGGAPWLDPVSVPAGLTGVREVAAGHDNYTIFLKTDGTVVASGGSPWNHASVPAGLTGVAHVVAGNEGGAAVKTDGTVVVWPSSYSGNMNMEPPAGLTGVTKLVYGWYTFLALKSDGTVVAWSPENTFHLLDVPAGLTGVVDIAMSSLQAYALKSDGTVVKWGVTDTELLADGTSTAMPAGISDVVKIAGGWTNMAAQKRDGSWVLWGSNYYGQLSIPSYITPANIIDIVPGDGMYAVKLSNDHGPTATRTKTPTASKTATATVTASRTVTPSPTATASKTPTVTATLTRSKTPTASVTLTPAGSTYFTAWDNDPWSANSPHHGAPVGTLGPLKAVSSGGRYTLALQTDGKLVSWSNWMSGGNSLPATIPAPYGTVGSGLVDVSASSTHALALKSDGTVVAWGCDAQFTAGCAVPSGLTGVARVIAGGNSSAAIKTNRSLVLWGGDSESAYTSLWNTYTDVVDVVMSSNQTVIVRADGTVEANFSYGNMTQLNSWVYRHNELTNVVDIEQGGAGDWYALKANGTVWCWCQGSVHQLQPATLTSVVKIVANQYLLTALSADKSAVGMYGTNLYSPECRLANVEFIATGESDFMAFSRNAPTCPTATPTITPSKTLTASRTRTPCATTCGYGLESWGAANNPVVLDTQRDLSGVTGIDAGAYHAVALRADGSVTVIGGVDFMPPSVPVGATSGVTAVATGGLNYVLALKSDGTLVSSGGDMGSTWGVPAGLSGVTRIDAGRTAALAVQSDGTVVAWPSGGMNAINNLVPVPTSVAGVSTAKLGNSHGIALKTDGTVVTWGDDTQGQATVPQGLSGVTAIGAGDYYSIALKGDGTVVVWGKIATNMCCSYGPITVPDGTTGITKIVAGPNGALLYKSDGTWIGIGTYSGSEQTTPAIPAGLNNVTDVALGDGYALAIVGTAGPVYSPTRTPAPATNTPAGPTASFTRTPSATKSPTLTKSITPTRTATKSPTRTPTKVGKPTKTPTKKK